MINYFQKSQRRRNILNKIKSNRIIINKFQSPLGIVPSKDAKPKEGFDFELKEDELYSYRISVSANKIPYLFLKLIKLFPSYATMVIELWVECGFVGFGIIDERTEFEVFINLDKEIIINTPYRNINNIYSILDYFNLLNENPSFISDFEHWHYPLSSVVSYETVSESDEYIFDYYDIINNLKHLYGFSIINMNERIIRKQPKWWNVTVKCLGKCKKISTISSYYIVANTIEEMETLIDEKMKDMNIENYYIYDFYNVEPNNYNPKNLNLSDIRICNFENAPFGIWAESDIFIYRTRNITSYFVNKNYALSS